MKISPFAAALCMAACTPAFAVQSTIVDFSQGTQGWQGPQGAGGLSWIATRASWLGDHGAAYRTFFDDFGVSFVNNSNGSFIGNYGATPSVEIGLDVYTKSIRLSGQQVPRDLVVELRDYDNPPDGYSYTSVWYDLGTLDPSKGWQTFKVTIADTSAAALPTGWGGTGAEDPVTFAPTLPADRTFASVLASVDEIAFTTLVPGYFYADTRFNVAIDDVFVRTISAVPEPAPALLLAAGIAVLGWRTRRRRAG